VLTVAAVIFGGELIGNDAITIPAALSIALSPYAITSALHLPTGQNDLLTEKTPSDELLSVERILKSRGSSSGGGRGSSGSRGNTGSGSRGITSGGSRARGFAVGGPIAGVGVYWMYRRNTYRNSNSQSTASQCFTQDAFERALLQNTTNHDNSHNNDTDIVNITNATSLTTNIMGDTNLTDTNVTETTVGDPIDLTSQIVLIETTVGDPINLANLDQQSIDDIKEAFNAAAAENIADPELCPMINAASSSKGVFVQVAIVAVNALKQVLLFF